jgi:hypothetical protein
MDFMTGPCILSLNCKVPTHELRKKCPGCQEFIHALCGRVLSEDEGAFKEDDVVCPTCDNSKMPARKPMPIRGSFLCCISKKADKKRNVVYFAEMTFYISFDAGLLGHYQANAKISRSSTLRRFPFDSQAPSFFKKRKEKWTTSTKELN